MVTKLKDIKNGLLLFLNQQNKFDFFLPLIIVPILYYEFFYQTNLCKTELVI
jgi:hypothetical protein